MPLPAPLPLWGRAALYLAPFAFAAGQSLFDAIQEEDDADQLAWLHVVYHGTRLTPAGTSEDKAQIGFDVCKLVGGANDPDWDSGQVAGAIDGLDDLLSFLVGYQSDNLTWSEVRAYVARFNGLGPGLANMGDPVFTGSRAFTGSSSEAATLPYQVALSVTEKTALRKHWGRVYVPCPATGNLDTYGRWKQDTTVAIAGIFGDAYEALAGNDYLVVVPSGASRTLFSVTEIQVDDIPDVQRRRRARQTAIRATHGAGS